MWNLVMENWRYSGVFEEPVPFFKFVVASTIFEVRARKKKIR